MPHTAQLSFQESSSTFMEPLDHLHDITIIILTAITIVLFTAGLCVVRTTISSPNALNHNILELLWTVLPGLILILLGAPSLRLLYCIDEHQTPVMSLRVTGHQWYWTYNYTDLTNCAIDRYLSRDLSRANLRLLDVDNRIIIPHSTPIRILVTRSDVLHAWSLTSPGLKVDATPGRVSQLYVVLVKRGVLYGQCSELCGVNHSIMPIVSDVVSWKSFVGSIPDGVSSQTRWGQ
jgi:heme/copper-type cytochrome/quinol oxidase subunit 2